jgi:glutathione synthase/RimK-type ligase-like ATP-grasp enzyme
MILLWGTLEDAPMAMAHDALVKAGADFIFLDHRRIFTAEIDSALGDAAGALCSVTQDGVEIDLTGVRVVYVRGSNFHDYEEMSGRPLDDPVALKAAGFQSQLTACLDASDALVINRSGPSATNNSKPYQLTVIRQAGLRIPETFISNDADAVRGFLSRNPESIFKSVSGVRSIVRSVSDDHRGLISDVGWCPTLFQRVVPGFNYRAHVLANEVLAVRLESDQLDYRYAKTTMVPVELPPDVADKCRRLNAVLGLHFSGIDLMRTPDGEWYCFEVNTSPGYSYFEWGSGQPISAALAKFMIDADRAAPERTLAGLGAPRRRPEPAGAI